LVDVPSTWTYTCAESTSTLETDWSVGLFADNYLRGYVDRCAVWREQYLLSAELKQRQRPRCRVDPRSGRPSARTSRPRIVPAEPVVTSTPGGVQ
jgi:hypothetical protein